MEENCSFADLICTSYPDEALLKYASEPPNIISSRRYEARGHPVLSVCVFCKVEPFPGSLSPGDSPWTIIG